jgi:hypothetical protein
VQELQRTLERFRPEEARLASQLRIDVLKPILGAAEQFCRGSSLADE